MEVMETIKKRRSIRSYKPDHIPENMLTDVLEAARWAPSWANSQCWEFSRIYFCGIRNKYG